MPESARPLEGLALLLPVPAPFIASARLTFFRSPCSLTFLFLCRPIFPSFLPSLFPPFSFNYMVPPLFLLFVVLLNRYAHAQIHKTHLPFQPFFTASLRPSLLLFHSQTHTSTNSTVVPLSHLAYSFRVHDQ
uniref:Uncharacterized protein n=1 Tax=Trypanosoma vivax (strain Y486) TaxID=1055687 RepID=G0UBZ5_TRYVY|nr:hypothetical protein TVY486_1108270 [Trypanosoma vivax Y486]